MEYVEGFVAPVPVENKQQYLEHITEVAKLFKKHGALNYVECWGDDVPQGKINSFPQAVLLKDNEVVVFSWVTWPSKSVREKRHEGCS